MGIETTVMDPGAGSATPAAMYSAPCVAVGALQWLDEHMLLVSIFMRGGGDATRTRIDRRGRPPPPDSR